VKRIFTIILLVAALYATQSYADNSIHNAKTGYNHNANTIAMQATDEINVANVYDALVWLKDSSVTVATLENYVLNSSLALTLLDYATNATLSNYITSSSLSSALSAYVTTVALNATLENYLQPADLIDYATKAMTSEEVLVHNANNTAHGLPDKATGGNQNKYLRIVSNQITADNIDHRNLTNIGTLTHDSIESELDEATQEIAAVDLRLESIENNITAGGYINQVLTRTANGYIWSTPTPILTDHTALTNIGSKTHAQLELDIIGLGIDKADTSSVYTKAETNATIENAIAAIPPTDLTNYTTKEMTSEEVLVHNDDTTVVHGITNTSQLATKAMTSEEVLVHNENASAHPNTFYSLTAGESIENNITKGGTNGQVLTRTATSYVWATPTSGVTDHLLLSNIGINAHTAIDSFITTAEAQLEKINPASAIGNSKYFGTNASGTGPAYYDLPTTSSSSSSYNVWTALDYPMYMTDADTITMVDNDTTDIYLKAGLPIKFIQGGTSYYAIINAVSTASGTHTVNLCGAPITISLAAGSCYGGITNNVRQLNFAINGYFGDAVDATLLANDMFTYYKWDLPHAYLCKVSIRAKTIDGGVANENINITIGTADVLTANTNAGLTVSTAWVNNTLGEVNTTNYDINFGDTLEVKTDGSGTNGDAKDLSVQLNFVIE